MNTATATQTVPPAPKVPKIEAFVTLPPCAAFARAIKRCYPGYDDILPILHVLSEIQLREGYDKIEKVITAIDEHFGFPSLSSDKWMHVVNRAKANLRCQQQVAVERTARTKKRLKNLSELISKALDRGAHIGSR